MSFESDKFPLPDMLLECLYAGVAYKIGMSIDGIGETARGVLAQRYMSEKQKAKMEGWDLPEDLKTTLEFKKGFL